jgi:hypothetical protein
VALDRAYRLLVRGRIFFKKNSPDESDIDTKVKAGGRLVLWGICTKAALALVVFTICWAIWRRKPSTPS